MPSLTSAQKQRIIKYFVTDAYTVTQISRSLRIGESSIRRFLKEQKLTKQNIRTAIRHAPTD